jgi:hypothetical protein
MKTKERARINCFENHFNQAKVCIYEEKAFEVTGKSLA